MREIAEFLNLYSKWRGINRFPGLVRVMDMLGERVEVLRRRPPAGITGTANLDGRGNQAIEPRLAARVKATGDADLELRCGGARPSTVPSARSSSMCPRSRLFVSRSRACRERPT